VRVVANTRQMRDVYSQTRVLLQPSVDESYGRVALEAAVSGIPVVAHPADGTRAAMADAAIYVDRADVEGWAAAIVRLDDPEEYATWSARARARFEALDPEGELLAFEAAMIETARPQIGRPTG
jgi:glycosyltransferase involved in cell wall biosynthesis